MSIRLLTFILIGVLLTAFASGQSNLSPKALTPEERIARLGNSGNNHIEDIQELAKKPLASTGLLVASFHTIPDTKDYAKADSDSMEHVLWLIRALRYMTGGLDFCAQSKHHFGASEEEKNRKYWLTLAHKNCLTFFAFWMSRGRWYIAPVDAQKSIISQWRRWYAAEGAKFVYKPLENPPPEKWMW
jgi:hypothetical protein